MASSLKACIVPQVSHVSDQSPRQPTETRVKQGGVTEEGNRGGWGFGAGLVDVPFPPVSMVPPREVVLEHVDAQQVVEFLLVPSLSSLLLQTLLPGIHKLDDALVIP